MRKVVFLLDQPFDARNFERFGIEQWRRRGWSIEVWDLTPLVHADVWRSFLQSGRTARCFEGYHQITSADDLRRRLAADGRVDYYVDIAGDTLNGIRAKLHLAWTGAVRIVLAVGSLPVAGSEVKEGRLRRAWKAFQGGPSRVASAMYGRAVAWLAPPGLVVVSGTNSLRMMARWANREIVKAHNLDYDLYLQFCAEGQGADAGAVFLDQDFCFHPDYAYDSIPAWATPDRYFATTRSGLETIARALNCHARVAAHPRSTYERDHGDVFGQIPIDRGQTAALIRDCSVVVCHSSAAIQLAVLFEKPVIFVTTDELAASPGGPSIEKFASELGKRVINLDADLSNIDWRSELTIDRERYDAYRRRHVKLDESPDRLLWEIIMDHIDRRAS